MMNMYEFDSKFVSLKFKRSWISKKIRKKRKKNCKGRRLMFIVFLFFEKDEKMPPYVF